MTYLKENKQPFPDEYKDSFPGYDGIEVGVSSFPFKSNASQISVKDKDNKEYILMKSRIYFALSPKEWNPMTSHIPFHSQSGPDFDEGDESVAIDKAKELIKDVKFLEMIISEHIKSLSVSLKK